MYIKFCNKLDLMLISKYLVEPCLARNHKFLLGYVLLLFTFKLYEPFSGDKRNTWFYYIYIVSQYRIIEFLEDDFVSRMSQLFYSFFLKDLLVVKGNLELFYTRVKINSYPTPRNCDSKIGNTKICKMILIDIRMKYY